MERVRRFPLRQRILAGLAGMGLLLLGPGVYSLVQLHQAHYIAMDLERHASAWEAMGQIRTALSDLDRSERAYLAVPDAVGDEVARAALARMRSGVDSLAAAGYAEEVRGTESLVAALERSHHELDSLVKAEDVERATEVFWEMLPLISRTRQELDQTGQTVGYRAARDLARSEALAAGARRTTLFGLLGAIVLAGLLGIGLTRSVTGPVLRLRESVRRVADGDFELPRHPDLERRDELGDLTRSFHRMTERLQELSRMRADLLSTAGHKLKTPLNVIRGYAEMLRDGVLGPVEGEQAEVLEEMEGQAMVLARQVDRLMELARAESGAMRIVPEPVNVPDMLRDLADIFEPQARQKRIELVVRRDDGAPPEILVDPDRFRDEVLGNLLSNALKFTGRGGRVGVRARARNGGAVFEVRDTGRGIPAEELELVFEKYHQVDAEARSMGTGLGLAIAREVVRAHDGEIWAESGEAEGTKFGVWIPLGGE